jgi:hypothetical protein
MRIFNVLKDFGHAVFGGLLPDLRTHTRAKTFGNAPAKLYSAIGLRECKCLRVRIGNHEINAVIILLTALPPAPPTPITTMRGLSSTAFGREREILIVTSGYG